MTIEEPDVIIAGGGTAGCIIASRLAVADPTLHILLLEAGSSNFENPNVVRPLNYLNIQTKPEHLKDYTSVVSDELGGRSAVLPQGYGLGGGSAVNFQMYTRGSASDFDDWNAPGWSCKELLPYFRKLETCHYASDETHGTNGPINVSYGGHQEPVVVRDGRIAVKAMGYAFVEDANDLHTGCGFQQWPKYVDPVTGQRQDVAHRYLKPVLEAGNTNLQVICEKQIVRILLENGKAVGVEYVDSDGSHFSGNPPGESTTVRAKKLVILSAGAIGTPGILERSGIGSPEVLERLNIPVQVSLPGVGKDYQDHPRISPQYIVSEDIDTCDNILAGDAHELSTAEAEYEVGRGKYATNALDFAGKLRPNAWERAEMGSHFATEWDKYYRDAPDKPLGIFAAVGLALQPIPNTKALTTCIYSGYPASRGSIHITGHVNSHPALDMGYLTHPADLPALIWLYKISREICRRMACVIGEDPRMHPSFDPSSPARVMPRYSRDSVSHPATIQHLRYNAADNAAIEDWIRATVATAWHALGTCAMKPREKDGVVDEKLKVYGVEKLMIADMSICPGNVGANTNNTALMIGEKAAALAAEFLGMRLD